MFSSSMVKNQIVAFIVSVVLIYIFYEGLYLFADLVIQPIDYYLSKFSMLEHFKSFERGIIDSRDVVYYLSVTVFFIMLTKVFYVSKK